jgi:hypothetical protein
LPWAARRSKCFFWKTWNVWRGTKIFDNFRWPRGSASWPASEATGSLVAGRRVPNYFKVERPKETLNIQVIYDTQELYGKINASRPVTVYPK